MKLSIEIALDVKQNIVLAYSCIKLSIFYMTKYMKTVDVCDITCIQSYNGYQQKKIYTTYETLRTN